MKVRNCLCGRGQECNGVSAAFRVLEDPRRGYTKVPKHDGNDAINNRLREAYLRNILPDGGTNNDLFLGQASVVDDSMNKQYIANHHFHPKIVEQSTTTSDDYIKCKIPNFISDEDVKSLQIGVNQEDMILDENGKPTGGYYIVPNYKFENAKDDLVQTVRARAAAQQIFREAKDMFKTPVNGTSSESIVSSGHIVTEANGTNADEEKENHAEGELHPKEAAKDPTGRPLVARSIVTGMMPNLVDTSSEEDEEQDNEYPQQEEEGHDEEGGDDFAVQSLGGHDGPLDSSSHSQEVLLNEHIRRMDLSLDANGSYSFKYQNFDIHINAEDFNGSGVLMSTAVHHMSDSKEAHNTGSMIRALQANRKLREKLDGAAYIVKKNDTVVLYFYTDVPRTGPQYGEFEESFLKFVNGALEMQSDIPGQAKTERRGTRTEPSS